ncbi:DUF4154 domain-containing protein [Janthinobacterium lividum]|nr:DUF4154 domain-containing protein [Janthinobacterium lividum]
MLIFNWTWWRHPGPLRRPVRGAGRRSLRWGWLLLLLGVLCADARAQVQVQVQGELERQVKAAYLYKFAGYVEWPDGSFARPDSPLVIGVAGADALAEQLEQSVAGHSVNGRAVQVKKSAPRRSADGAARAVPGCAGENGAAGDAGRQPWPGVADGVRFG